MGKSFPLGIVFAKLGSIFVKKMLKVWAIFTALKSKAPLCFKEHGIHLLFLPTLTIEQIDSQTFDRTALIV